jgi:hypothetical protein
MVALLSKKWADEFAAYLGELFFAAGVSEAELVVVEAK